jgi:phosphate transport system protein
VGRHISEQYDAELEHVWRRLMEMGGLVELQATNACRALAGLDQELAVAVQHGDRTVNRHEIGIDDECTQIIARRQPAARDLRLVVTMMKTATDLERIGDESARIARMAARIGTMRSRIPFPAELMHLQTLVPKQISSALDALARSDVAAALRCIDEDRPLDRNYEAVVREIVAAITVNTDAVECGLHLIWAARSMERIGDHAKNVAEYVIYLVEGRDVRHAAPATAHAAGTSTS